ncbi:hypothetical protein [Marivivens donghaensis]|uniref:hypothetical protein n=1 Tax=Marivivens donghaensis TaxID=1699413 RepID=UPI00201FA863|nr:hypothetical protein [Marivivens donghaensis]MCL7409871.1 hypothetical protein [Marivivens donghaensis]MDN3705306.1 hypothetical protein [Marivivens donghaensis]
MLNRLFAIASVGLLAGCMSPLDKVGRLDEVELATDAPEAAIAAEADVTVAEDIEEKRGFFGRIFAGNADAPDEAVVVDDTPEAEVELAAVEVTEPVDDLDPETPAARGGFFGRMFARNSDEAEAPAEPADAVPIGTFLPYGVIAPVCGIATSDMGQKVESVAGYTVYDAGGDTSVPRTHYITGFADGCARQVTAAVVMFGDVGTHEMVRYLTPESTLPYTDTDSTYEAIKSSVCRVGHGKPCGAQLDALGRNTVFMTVYETFGTNPEWTNILLHNGDVAAIDEH